MSMALKTSTTWPMAPPGPHLLTSSSCAACTSSSYSILHASGLCSGCSLSSPSNAPNYSWVCVDTHTCTDASYFIWLDSLTLSSADIAAPYAYFYLALSLFYFKGYPRWLSRVKNLPAKAGDVGLTSRLGRSPGEGNGNPLQQSCLGNPMDRGAWWATVRGVTKELDTT